MRRRDIHPLPRAIRVQRLLVAAAVAFLSTTAWAQSYTWGYRAASGSTALSANPWSVGSGTSDYLLIGVGYNGTNGSGM